MIHSRPQLEMKNGATIVDVARKLGVSPMTVSRALNGSSEVSEQTRERVLACARELRYRPHPWARSLVTRKSSIVGIVVPDIAHSYFAEITRGVEEVLEPAGYDLLLCHSSLDPRKETSEIETLLGSRVAGLIVASEQPERAPGVFVELRENGTPFVLVDRFFPGHDFPAVRVDDIAVGRLATEHLLELRHKAIAHIRGSRLSPGALRYRGYQNALRAHGLSAVKDHIVYGTFDIESGRVAMKSLLALPNRPTAVFAANDPMAIGAIYACQQAGVSVPDDISIVGAGNIEGAHHPFPFLTTVDWSRTNLGRNAAELLVSIIAHPDEHAFKADPLIPRLLNRQSTAAPRRARASGAG
jgi:DNA-binding LacI/PurR family transcriptional regulator